VKKKQPAKKIPIAYIKKKLLKNSFYNLVKAVSIKSIFGSMIFRPMQPNQVCTMQVRQLKTKYEFVVEVGGLVGSG